MREIKFRAWYKPFKDNDFGAGYKYGNNVISFHDMSPEKYELEQYTGMTDKNGVEIYEGDIIQTSTGELQTVVGITPIYINEDIYTLVQATKSLSGEIFILDNSDVVIGNIHENPELLEVD